MKMSRIYNIAKKIKFVVFDFDGVFTDNCVFIDENGQEFVRCYRSDGIGLSRLKEIGVDLLILSSEPNDILKHRARKLKIKYINNCRDKFRRLSAEIKKRGLLLNQVAYAGNDINDSECLKKVGFPIVIADSHRDIVKLARYRTKLKGGKGAVREICDFIYNLKTRGSAR